MQVSIPSAADGITIATAGITVKLRSLTFEGLSSATYGINVTSVGTLHVEDCVISGFAGTGININLTGDGSYIFIKDTIVRATRERHRNHNKHRDGTGFDRQLRSERNFNGSLLSFNSLVTINRSVASGNSGAGSMRLAIPQERRRS